MKQKLLNFTTEVKDLGEGEIQTIVASDSVDRHGEILDIAGLDIKKFQDNPVIQWAHNYEMPPIAKATKVWKSAGKLMAKMQFFLSDKSISDQSDHEKFIRTIYDLIKEGFLNAVSIGFMPIEMDGNTYTKSEMVEFSVVPVPANSEALIQIRKLGLDNDILNKYTDLSMKYKLSEVLEKDIKDLTVGEISFLKESINDMTKEQVKKFASVLKEETSETEAEKVAREAKEKADADAKAAEEEKAKEDTAKLEALQKDVDALKNADPIVIKNINGQIKNFNVKKDEGEVKKELKLLYYLRGVKSGNFSEYLNVVGKDAMNTSDDNVVLPPEEFVSEIQRMEEAVGVARRFATVRQSASGKGIKYVMGDDDVEIFDTAESGIKKSTKLSYKELLLGWRKFAAILPLTDELSEDSAIDIWKDATARFSRAYSKREDKLVFTEVANGGNTKNGIVNVAGTNIVEVASLVAITYADLVDMVYGVPSQSGNSGQFYFNRTMLGSLMKMKDGDNRPIWLPAIASGNPATILNRPYVETEVLPGIEDADPGVGMAVYGDLKFVTLGDRNQMSVKIFDTGIVGDADEEDQADNQINLLTQDVQAMRVVKRMNAVVRFPEAFSVLKIASGS